MTQPPAENCQQTVQSCFKLSKQLETCSICANERDIAYWAIIEDMKNGRKGIVSTEKRNDCEDKCHRQINEPHFL